MSEVSGKVVYCKQCSKNVNATIKMWDTRICPHCNIIISSDIGIDKVSK